MHVYLNQKGSYYMGIKLFNYLPLNLKKLYKDVRRFKLKLKDFLSCHPFYTVDEYIEYSSGKDWLYSGWFYVSYIFICIYIFIDLHLILFIITVILI
jgi:hypothetical protein